MIACLNRPSIYAVSPLQRRANPLILIPYPSIVLHSLCSGDDAKDCPPAVSCLASVTAHAGHPRVRVGNAFEISNLSVHTAAIYRDDCHTTNGA